MKFHHLELEAFGVFRDKQVVDFDELNDASLFLIRGNNGAGKTTILDAICFALYGEVPGLRGESRAKKVDGEQATSLKSDYAADTVAPYVTLEFTVAGTRYRVRRQPSWQKQGKKSEEKAKAELHRFNKGSWGDPIASGPPDVNMALFGWKKTRQPREKREPGILGLDIDQFSMIVMLPQGKFSEFLRASSDTRAALLGAIFPVSDYEKITAALAAQKNEAASAISEARAELEASFNQLIGALDLETPHEASNSDMWIDDFTNRTAVSLAAAEAALNACASASVKAKEVFDAAKSAYDKKEKIENARLRKSYAEDELAALRTTLRSLDLDGVDPTKPKSRKPVQSIVDDLKARLVALAELAELAAAEVELETKTEEIGSHEAELKGRRSKKAELSKFIASGKDLRDKLQAGKEKLGVLQNLESHLKAIAVQRDQMNEARHGIPGAEELVRRARELLDELGGAFAVSTAARLSIDLEDGAECLVCGSTNHPKLATFSGHIPAEEEIEAAEKSLERATTQFRSMENKIAGFVSAEKVLLAQLSSNYELDSEKQAKESLKAKDNLAEEISVLAAKALEIEAAEDELERLDPEIEGAAATVESLKQDKAKLEGEISGKKSHLSEFKLTKDDLATRDDLVEALANAEKRLEIFDGVAEAWPLAQAVIAEARTTLELLGEVGKVPTAEALMEAKSVFDLAQFAESEARDRVSRFARHKEALASFEKKSPEKRAALVLLQNEHDEIEHLFKVANGQVGMKVNLVNFYLGQRLRQIAALASDRLLKMSDNHFYLEHSESSKAGNKKVGLELNLFDTWTMSRRPVGDFSGGELFMASLALALALSDVVKAESGSSISLDTLFIDEGFGSLDPTFTDTVVSVLEELRTYGRIVGLVSHVSDIQERIPTQLVIEKTKQGSKVLPIRLE